MFAENSLLSSSRNPLITEFFSDTFNYEFPFLPSLPPFVSPSPSTDSTLERAIGIRQTDGGGGGGRDLWSISLASATGDYPVREVISRYRAGAVGGCNRIWTENATDLTHSLQDKPLSAFSRKAKEGHRRAHPVERGGADGDHEGDNRLSDLTNFTRRRRRRLQGTRGRCCGRGRCPDGQWEKASEEKQIYAYSLHLQRQESTQMYSTIFCVIFLLTSVSLLRSV